MDMTSINDSLHLALTYAPIVNDGTIPSPYIIKTDKQPKA